MDNPLQPENGSAQPKKEDQLTFKRSHLYSVLLPLAFVTGLSLGYLFWGRSDQTPNTVYVSVTATPDPSSPTAFEVNIQPTPTEIPTKETTRRYDVPVDDDPVIGEADAPITIIEFSDYECPYCRQWHNDVLKPLLEAYPDQIRFVYRDFPLSSIHYNASSAAEAADCAGDQDQYWDFADKLFLTEDTLSTDLYMSYAEELGLDMDAFKECVDSRKYESEVQADYDYAVNLGINSTPTFFINGIALVGAQPLTVFTSVIDQELAGEIP